MASHPPDTNPYESSDTTEISLEQQLISEESMLGTVVGAVIGAVPGFSAYLILIGIESFYYLAYIVPGIMVGMFARFMGRGIKKKHNLIAAIITFVGVITVHGIVFLPPGAEWLSLINVVLAGALSGRRLSRAQSDAVFDYKIGLKKDV